MTEAAERAGRVAVGHPVDVATGAVFTTLHDFNFPGTLPLVWKRHYSSVSEANGRLGRGWSIPFFMELQRVAAGYRLLDEEGSFLLFPISAEALEAGERAVSYGANMELQRDGDLFVLTHWHFGSDDVQRFVFEPHGASLRLARIENLACHRISITYSEDGAPWRIKQELEERVVELTHDARNLLRSVHFVTSDGGKQLLALYEYDADDNLTAASDAAGSRVLYRYDRQSRLLSETSPLGSTFSFRYDRRGRCVYSSGDNRYMERRLQYLTTPRSTRVTDSLGNTSHYYIKNGLVIQQITPLGATETTDYDQYGRVASVTDPLGAVVSHQYDEGGNRCAMVHEDGSVTTFCYDDRHLLMELTDPGGRKWSYERDPQGNITALVDPLGHRFTCSRDGKSLVVESQTPAGLVIRRRYGPALRWVEASDQISLLSRLEYDDRGNQVAAYDALGLLQRVRFDELNRPVAAEDADGKVYSLRWNAIGELVERIGPDIGWERREYDIFGQLVRHSNPLGQMLIDYDSEGRITAVVNRAGDRLERSYDADGNLICETTFDGRVERCEYNLRNEPVKVARPDGREILFRFDRTGALIGREGSGGVREKFTFDKSGLLVKAETDSTCVELERDAVGRVVAEVQNGRRIEYRYDADGNRTGRRIPAAGDDLTLKKDVRGRLSALLDAQGTCQEFTWDVLDRLVERRLSPSATESLCYDSGGHLASQRVFSLYHGAVVDRRYLYDDMDNIIAIEDGEVGRAEFAYDQIGRLLQVKQHGVVSEYYRYDAVGTVLESHRGFRSVGKGGRTFHDGERLIVYDANGCVASIQSGPHRFFFEYDADNRLVVARAPDGAEVAYHYDALGRRTCKDHGDSQTEFLWEGCLLAAEGGNGGFEQRYFFNQFDPLVQWRGEERLSLVTDVTGAVREVLDQEGALLWKSTLEAYGRLASERGAPASPFRFRGQYFDAETGFHYNFHRTYDPRLGDYLSPDPVGMRGGSNFYGYPRNPLLWDDPFGLKCGRPSCKAEEEMEKHYAGRGYTKIDREKSVFANGIDGIFHSPGGNPEYIIAEAKSGRGRLGKTGPEKVQQMSDAWINGTPGNASKTRLEAALPPPNPHLENIQNAQQGSVHKEVYNPGKDPPVYLKGKYNGQDSHTTSF